ncbi:MAG: hypothetical protein HY754_02360 [Nitrospirae bacterium]|nr:hypothetical protein [Nitrospirota bacterium]
MDSVSLGLTYVTPQPVDHQNVYDFDGNGTKEDLELASPQQVGFGIAFEPIMGTLLIEGDVRWVNWANADGYEDFDWDNQWVYAIGAQYKPVKNVALRVGYNYGKNPVKEHNNFDAATFTNVQGTDVSTLNYEMLRIVGFPAVVEQHITLGIGYEVSKSFALNLGYKHAFEKTIKESGSYYGIPVAFESTLSEDAVDLGLTWRF